MRYFAELAYRGTDYCGWQNQPDQVSVQGTIEEALSLILRNEIAVTGCGRTDTGVHASQYFVHFDFTGTFPLGFLNRINKFLPADISIYRIVEMSADAHARYDAHYRKYGYYIDTVKNPFHTDLAYHFPFFAQLDRTKVEAAAALILEFDHFFTFCKTNTDVKTMKCQIFQSEWEWQQDNNRLTYHVAANRFLRGMVRLLVGMCLNVGIGKLALAEVRLALEQQKRLAKDWSVPAHGLFLEAIRYPYDIVGKNEKGV